MNQWTEIRRKVLVDGVSKRSVCPDFGGSIAKAQVDGGARTKCFHYAGSVCPDQASVAFCQLEVSTPKV
jgi:hypothetical protein